MGRPRVEIDQRLLRSGLVPADIAARVGCDAETVRARMREAGIPLRRRGQRGRDRRKRKPGSGSLTPVSHGMHGTAIYAVWSEMVGRCRRRTHPDWSKHGGRGVRVCDAWLDFTGFLDDVSKLPGYPYDRHGCRVIFGVTMTRIDPHGDYEPANVRWVAHLK